MLSFELLKREPQYIIPQWILGLEFSLRTRTEAICLRSEVMKKDFRIVMFSVRVKSGCRIHRHLTPSLGQQGNRRLRDFTHISKLWGLGACLHNVSPMRLAKRWVGLRRLLLRLWVQDNRRARLTRTRRHRDSRMVAESQWSWGWGAGAKRGCCDLWKIDTGQLRRF